MNESSSEEIRSRRAMPPLNLPSVELKIKRDGKLVKVFDPIRSKYVNLTPEEYVRIHFVNFMMLQLHYPASIMANEVGIRLNGLQRRCDTVVYRPDGTPLVIVEYKAPDVPITQKVFDQIVRYNMKLTAKYLIVSNGFNHYCCAIDYERDTYHFIPRIPDYRDIISPVSDN